MRMLKIVVVVALLGMAVTALRLPAAALAADLPIVDAHIHYSHDAWTVVPPKEAVALLRRAGVKRALVSSSNDEGTQMLVAEAPDAPRRRKFGPTSTPAAFVGQGRSPAIG